MTAMRKGTNNSNSNGSANSYPFEVRGSRIQGKGVFAIRRIHPGRRIIEYTGERISSDEEALRYDDTKMQRHHTFLFEIDDDTSIDAAVGGNEARFINHSCEPNCEAVNEEGRIFIEAIKNIQPGVELTYDYNYEHDGRISEEERKFYYCRCGSKRCRGTILREVRKRKRSSSATKRKHGTRRS